MSTDSKFVRLFNKKLLPFAQYKDNFLDYLRKYIEDVQKTMYDQDCAIGPVRIPVAAAGVNNKIDIGLAGGPYKGTNGLGQIISFGNNDSRLQDVPVPPDAAAVYHVALEVALIEDGIETNVRTGEQEYQLIKEEIGRLRAPTSVTDNGNGTITFNVNSLFGSGENHAGRQVKVWLTPKQDGGLGPQSSNPVVAFETCTVAYSAPNNTITTAAKFGQGAVSTTAANYKVCAIGPTIRLAASEDLRNTSGALFLASVTSVAAGNPIVTISTGDQRLAFITLSDLADVRTRYAICHAGEFLVKSGAAIQFDDVPGADLASDHLGEAFVGVPSAGVYHAIVHIPKGATVTSLDIMCVNATAHVPGGAADLVVSADLNEYPIHAFIDVPTPGVSFNMSGLTKTHLANEVALSLVGTTWDWSYKNFFTGSAGALNSGSGGVGYVFVRIKVPAHNGEFYLSHVRVTYTKEVDVGIP